MKLAAVTVWILAGAALTGAFTSSFIGAFFAVVMITFIAPLMVIPSRTPATISIRPETARLQIVDSGVIRNVQ